MRYEWKITEKFVCEKEEGNNPSIGYGGFAKYGSIPLAKNPSAFAKDTIHSES